MSKTPVPSQQLGAPPTAPPDILFSHDRCLICNRAGELFCCDACPCAAHLRCVQTDKQHLSSKSDWFCPFCLGTTTRLCCVCDEPAIPIGPLESKKNPKKDRLAMTCPFCLNRTHITCSKVPIQLHLLGPFSQSRQMKNKNDIPTLEDFDSSKHTLFYPCYFCLEVREVDMILASYKSFHLVKLRNSAYVHSFWLGQAALKIYAPTKRRHHSPSQGGNHTRPNPPRSLLVVESDEENLPDGPFAEPNNLEIDFIIDDFQKKSNNKKAALPTSRHPSALNVHARPKGVISKMLLVKWKGLSYNDATWEYMEFVETYWPKTIAHFEALKTFQFPEAKPLSTQFEDFEESPPFINNLPPPFDKLHEQDADLSLFDFQVKGLNFLCRAWHQSKSVILGDEMGLGKTIQAIGFLRYLMLERGVTGPFLIIAPLSTLENFRSELSRWLPFAYPVPFVGNRASRGLAKHFQFPAKGESPGFEILLTSFEVLRLQANALRSFNWRALIVDEAHRLKNQTSKLFGALCDFKADFRLLLTGTPLQNTLLELCSLLRFLDPPQFARIAAQNSHFDSLQSLIAKENPLDKEEEQKQQQQLQTMRKILEERMLRRRKQEVMALPPLEQEVVWLPLTVIQQRWSKLIMFRNFEMTSLFEKGRHLRKISSLYVKLRHICNHPFLLSRSEQAPEQDQSEDELQTLIKASSKLEWLDQKLPTIKEKGEKVLIFTQTRLMLDLLERFFELRSFTFLRLDGQTPSAKRQVLVDTFNSSSDSFAFLLSTRAGGLGLNISSASTVIIYESDFNPHNDLQALSRAHRLGQTSSVTVFRLLCKDSVEEGIFKMARRKLFLQDLLTPSVSQPDQLNPESSAKSAFKAVTHEAAALFKSPSVSQKLIEIDSQSELQNLSKNDEKSDTPILENDKAEINREEEKQEVKKQKDDSEEDRGQTQEWVENFRRQFQEYKEGEAAEMGKGKRERKTRKSDFVSFEEIQLSEEEYEAMLLEDAQSEGASDAFHWSASQESRPLITSDQSKQKPTQEGVPKMKMFQIQKLTSAQAEHERKVYKERQRQKEIQRAAEEKIEKERAKQIAQIQAAIHQTNATKMAPAPPLIRPTPTYAPFSSPPAVPIVRNSGMNTINHLYHPEQSSFHATNSPRSGSISGVRSTNQDHPLITDLRNKANILARYANQPFQENRLIVGFSKQDRLEFVNLVRCFGFSHSLAQWEAIYKKIKSTYFLVEAFPIVRRKVVNQFQVYALTFGLFIDTLSKSRISPFTVSHFMLGKYHLTDLVEAQIQISTFRSALKLLAADPSSLRENQLKFRHKFYQDNKFTPGWTQRHDKALLEAVLHTGLTHIRKILHTSWNSLTGGRFSATQVLSKVILGEGYEKDINIEEGMLKKRVSNVVLDALIMRLKMITEFMISH